MYSKKPLYSISFNRMPEKTSSFLREMCDMYRRIKVMQMAWLFQ